MGEKFKQAEKEKMRFKTWRFHSETEICTFTIDRLIKTTSTRMTCRLVFELDNDGAILKCFAVLRRLMCSLVKTTEGL